MPRTSDYSDAPIVLFVFTSLVFSSHLAFSQWYSHLLFLTLTAVKVRIMGNTVNIFHCFCLTYSSCGVQVYLFSCVKTLGAIFSTFIHLLVHISGNTGMWERTLLCRKIGCRHSVLCRRITIIHLFPLSVYLFILIHPTCTIIFYHAVEFF